MATDALTAFLSRDFPAAHSALAALQTDAPDDPRITHNALLTRFYQHQRHAQVDDFVLFVASFLPHSPANASAFWALIADTPALLKPLYATPGPVALYNVAAIAYGAGHLKAAAAVGAVLYANVEAMDDWLALKSCFLLTDVLLRKGDAPAAATPAAYAERLLPAFSRVAAEGDAHVAAPASDIPVLAPTWQGRHSSVVSAPASYEDAKFCMHIYNARLSAETAGTRSIRKEAKSAVLAADDEESRPTSVALLVKARVEQGAAKGLRILGSVGNQTSPHVTRKVRPLALNSLGILHHRLGRHAVAACYFEHARRAFAQLFKEGREGEVNLSVLRSVEHSHVCYNLAVQHMKLGDYAKALEFFTTAARNDAILATESALTWIRMAECCVGMDRAGARGRQTLVVKGRGRGRRLIMRADARDEGLGMEYASTCARAAIAILDKPKARSEDENLSPHKAGLYSIVSGAGAKSERGEGSDLPTSSSNSDAVTLRGAALCLLAYSALSFDPHAALDACDELVQLYPGVDRERGVLGRLYAAEALCMLGRAEEAASRLSSLLLMNISPDSNVKEAACINMALSHISDGDSAAATRAAKAALKLTAAQRRPTSLRKHASFVAAYIFLRNGELDAARQTLRSLHTPSD